MKVVSVILSGVAASRRERVTERRTYNQHWLIL
jgi:hypothetical protein